MTKKRTSKTLSELREENDRVYCRAKLALVVNIMAILVILYIRFVS
jgi:hypothetical protein